jgi:hypothetical protein
MESGFRGFRLECLGLPAVRPSYASRSVVRSCIVALSPPFNDGQDIDRLRHEPSRLPEAHRIGRLGSVGARALVGEVAGEGLLLRAMQRSQNNAAKCLAGICSAVFPERLAKSTQSIQHGWVKRPLPKFAGRDVACLTFGQNSTRFSKDVIHGGRCKLGGRDGNSHLAGIHPKRTETEKSRREIGGAPAAEGIKHDITCSGSPLQDVERKIEREHREVGANSV